MPPRARPEQQGASTNLRGQVASPTNSHAEVHSAQKFNEAERIRVSAWPKRATFRQWRTNLVGEIVAVSVRPQRATAWTLEMVRPGVSHNDLREAGDDVATLDA